MIIVPLRDKKYYDPRRPKNELLLLIHVCEPIAPRDRESHLGYGTPDLVRHAHQA